MKLANNVVGIDISKDRLDLYSTSQNRFWDVANEAGVLEELCDSLEGSLVVFEATSVYDRTLVRSLSQRGIAHARVNPRRAREFARSAGYLAKTDKVDARMLAHMGSVLETRPQEPQCPHREALRDLLQRRDQLVSMRAQEKTRLRQVDNPLLQEDITSLIELLGQRIATFEARIRQTIDEDAGTAQQAAILQTAPGIGPITAATLIADMPELGQRDRRAIAALAGLAPLANDSGKRHGNRRIWGGRRRVRRLLYLAALSAIRTNPAFRETAQQLKQQGKAPKTAVIAVARKLLVTLNAMSKNQAAFKSA